MKSALHLEESLQRDINVIRAKILEMGSLGEKALQNGLQALLENNRQLAYLVILRDQWIDEAEKKLDQLCLEFLVRQIPAGQHLRFVYAALKMNNELERIGDYAESIAKQVLKISSLEPRPDYSKFKQIAELSIRMLHMTIEAFLENNVEKVREAMKMEGEADDIREQINNELVRWRQDGKIPLESLTPLMTIARRYERVSDQAKNICEEVLYMCTGEYSKHQGTEHIRILFVDEGNSCRSQMAEGIAQQLNQPGFSFQSAGTAPRSVDPRTVAFLKNQGLDISKQTSKALSTVGDLERFQVIVLLNRGAERAIPVLNKTLTLEWFISDPSKVTGTDAEVQKAYQDAFHYLDSHIKDLVQAILGTHKT